MIIFAKTKFRQIILNETKFRFFDKIEKGRFFSTRRAPFVDLASYSMRHLTKDYLLSLLFFKTSYLLKSSIPTGTVDILEKSVITVFS
jgi:hypothetical protein